jgi:Rad3-related DNA helicase
MADWINKVSSYSAYANLMPEQTQLLTNLYALLNSRKRVVIASAPPASGKTHLISIVAMSLSQSGKHSVAIVTPTNHLKNEFRREAQNVKGAMPSIDIVTISEYLKINRVYDYVLIDESHNLKSFVELSPDIVKTIVIGPNDPGYWDLQDAYLNGKKKFCATRVSYGWVSGFLRTLNASSNRRFAHIESPTSWMYFVYVWQYPQHCLVKAVDVSKLTGWPLPKVKLILLSATPLSDEEMSYYCGIRSSSTERAPIIRTDDSWKDKQTLYLTVEDDLSDDQKIAFTRDTLNTTKLRTLVLLNSARKCLSYSDQIQGDRFFSIPAEDENREDVFEDFLKFEDGVLMTASTLFWEGVTIRGLKLLIIPNPPYPRPHLFELLKKEATNGSLEVGRRLRQGIGRVSRQKGDWGVCVLLFNPENTFARSVFPVEVHRRLIHDHSWNIVNRLQEISSNRSL